MHGISICEICKQEYRWRRRNCDKAPRFCSRKCRNDFGHIGFRPGGKIRISELTFEENIERIKKYFEKYVIRQEGCWDWKGIIEHTGYAKLGIRPPIKAHRASWIIYRGDIPLNMCICHTCDNRKCTNPEHLWLGTHKENIQDKIKKGRTNAPKGTRARHAILNDEKVKEIKIMLQNGLTCSEIGRQYKVSRKIISRIKNNETWKHVEV